MLPIQPSLVDSVKELEPLPPTVTRLAALLTAADWEMEEVEECVALDQALTAKLLRIANSALWSRGHPIATVRQAVMRMGSGTLVALAMGAGVQRRFARALPQWGLREGELWSHSVAAALAAGALAEASPLELPPESFASALLHDVGKLVTARTVAQAPAAVTTFARGTDGGPPESAIDPRNLDHAALGGVTAVHWHLPERLVAGVAWHHEPASCDDPIASLVHVADVVAHRLGDREGVAPPPLQAAALERVQLREADLGRITGEVGEELADVLRRFA